MGICFLFFNEFFVSKFSFGLYFKKSIFKYKEAQNEFREELFFPKILEGPVSKFKAYLKFNVFGHGSFKNSGGHGPSLPRNYKVIWYTTSFIHHSTKSLSLV